MNAASEVFLVNPREGRVSCRQSKKDRFPIFSGILIMGEGGSLEIHNSGAGFFKRGIVWGVHVSSSTKVGFLQCKLPGTEKLRVLSERSLARFDLCIQNKSLWHSIISASTSVSILLHINIISRENGRAGVLH